ncbi:ribosome biogenesis factor YjgA [Aeromonas bivalvium]|uniref:Dual-action ribosomal maturation protein DarP n=1 Tax=Aeromonas bivalvium TaxID=440079 RepID=A0ABW9GRB8_9GAMM|nr:ribosome biogenesis factor YjgA [Aeromonas bivalvium]
MSHFNDEQEFEDWGPSKSQLKREAEILQKMGDELVDLSHSELEKIPLDEELAEAVELGRRLKPKKDESFRRHLQFIGRLMRSRDIEPIAEALSIIKNRHSTINARLHRLEQWRERLIVEGDEALNELMSQFHELDRQKLRQLIRNAKKERELNKPPAAFREIYQYLRGEIEDKL